MRIYEFDNYKYYLQNHLKQLPKEGWGYLSRWAELLSVKSSFLGQVLKADKNLSSEQAFLLGKAIGLKDLEFDYFVNLVQKARAGNFELENYYIEKLLKIREQAGLVKSHITQTKELDNKQKSEYYSRWFFSAVRIYASIGKGKSINEISDRLQISRKLVEKVLKFLCETNICDKNGEIYTTGSQRLMVHKEEPNYHKHLTNWRLKAIEQSQLNKDMDLFVTSPMSLSIKDFEIVRGQILDLLKSVSKQVESTCPEEAFCLNLDLFKI